MDRDSEDSNLYWNYWARPLSALEFLKKNLVIHSASAVRTGLGWYAHIATEMKQLYQDLNWPLRSVYVNLFFSKKTLLWGPAQYVGERSEPGPSVELQPIRGRLAESPDQFPDRPYTLFKLIQQPGHQCWIPVFYCEISLTPVLLFFKKLQNKRSDTEKCCKWLP